MQDKINKLNNMYRDEIESILNRINSEEEGEKTNFINLGNALNDIFKLTELEAYNDYVNLMNEIEDYDSRLASKLERYLSLELNLMALLAFHAGYTRGKKIEL